MKYFAILFVLFGSLSIFAQTDTTAPEVSSFFVLPHYVNVAAGAQNVGFSIRAVDDLSGVASVRARLHSPSNSQRIDVDFDAAARVSGDNKDGRYYKNIVFPTTSETGTWLVEYIYVRDTAGNDKTLNTQDLSGRGILFLFQVSANVCTYSLEQTSQNFPVEGGSGVIIGTSQQGCTASLFNHSSFVIANSVSGAFNLGSVLTIRVPFTVPANTGAARSGVLTVSGIDFTVNQAGAKTRKRIRFLQAPEN